MAPSKKTSAAHHKTKGKYKARTPKRGRQRKPPEDDDFIASDSNSSFQSDGDYEPEDRENEDVRPQLTAHKRGSAKQTAANASASNTSEADLPSDISIPSRPETRSQTAGARKQEAEQQDMAKEKDSVAQREDEEREKEAEKARKEEERKANIPRQLVTSTGLITSPFIPSERSPNSAPLKFSRPRGPRGPVRPRLTPEQLAADNEERRVRAEKREEIEKVKRGGKSATDFFSGIPHDEIPAVIRSMYADVPSPALGLKKGKAPDGPAAPVASASPSLPPLGISEATGTAARAKRDEDIQISAKEEDATQNQNDDNGGSVVELDSSPSSGCRASQTVGKQPWKKYFPGPAATSSGAARLTMPEPKKDRNFFLTLGLETLGKIETQPPTILPLKPELGPEIRLAVEAIRNSHPAESPMPGFCKSSLHSSSSPFHTHTPTNNPVLSTRPASKQHASFVAPTHPPYDQEEGYRIPPRRQPHIDHRIYVPEKSPQYTSHTKRFIHRIPGATAQEMASIPTHLSHYCYCLEQVEGNFDKEKQKHRVNCLEHLEGALAKCWTLGSLAKELGHFDVEGQYDHLAGFIVDLAKKMKDDIDMAEEIEGQKEKEQKRKAKGCGVIRGGHGY
ncbi:hypothetical protein MKZ38_010398 [Zalerion maritima]|uniref:Uncharacterized protein n=1 Tax=Zalerion maritima TaxID=339359 RepID=A0AAD5WV56_9PEZI|nr:hypothetical protein MKZ38_010398 [Zalerion maritima]